MISSLNKNIMLEDYKENNEQFIYGIKGIVRLPLGREVMYSLARVSMYNCALVIPKIYKIECTFAVTDKRILLIPVNNTYKTISFNYGDIDVVYHDQLLDKVFLLNIKNKKLLDFCEYKLVFKMYSKQNAEFNKINCILQEYNCV